MAAIAVQDRQMDMAQMVSSPAQSALMDSFFFRTGRM
jgi:hypothetical protein